MDRTAEMLEQAIAHHRDRRLAEAEVLYRQIVLAEPRHADALYLWGRLEFDRGEFARAVELIEQAIAVDPQEATFRFHLGEAQRAQGLLEPAVCAYRQALSVRADYALAWCSLGMSLERLDQPQEAEQAFRQALRVQPRFAEALTNLAALVRRQGRWDEARQLLQAAVQLRPDLVEAWNNLGNALRDGGLQLEATQAYDRAIALAPQYGAAHFNRGLALARLGNTSAAADAFREATRLDAADAEAWANLSATLNDLGQPDDAEMAACQAIALRPGSAEAHGNLGVALQAQGAQDEAIEHYRQAVEFDPRNAGQHGNLLYALNYHSDYDPATIFAEHRDWARRHADPLTAVAAAHAPRPRGGRRLRIGYVSAHFRAHAVNAFAEPLLAAHDHQRFEVICYANQPSALCDDTTARLQAQADQWRDIYSLNDEQAAALIRADQIDILVDLTGHIAGNRLLVFARKPAPIQVTYLGYQNTTGMRAMDYRLTDDWADPAGQTDRWYTEQLVRLPDAFFCYQPWAGASEVTSSPLARNGYVTFGSFNNFAKVTPQVLSTWSQVLQAVPGSRLLLLAPPTRRVEASLWAALDTCGIDRQRVKLHPRCTSAVYLQLLGQADVAFDPFPFNGHTTTCDALWQGVPVVSLAGNCYAARFGSSALRVLGLEDLIATSPAQYIEVSAQLARDAERLAELHSQLRLRMKNSVLVDGQRFARRVEQAYFEMWSRWSASS